MVKKLDGDQSIADFINEVEATILAKGNNHVANASYEIECPNCHKKINISLADNECPNCHYPITIDFHPAE